MQVEKTQVLLREGGVQLLLTVVDTPGFGDSVDNSNWYVTTINKHGDHLLFTCLTLYLQMIQSKPQKGNRLVSLFWHFSTPCCKQSHALNISHLTVDSQ